MHISKDKIIAASIWKQQKLIDDFQQRIKDIMITNGDVNEEEYDNHKQALTSQALAEVSLLSDQLEFANHELEALRKVDAFSDVNHKIVGFGSVVVTDNGTYFVSTSVEQFEVNGHAYVGVSVQSPLYLAMKGLTIGDRFPFGGKEIQILDIY